ncbi:MAG: AraC family transcriptional regulator [Caldicoprobacterales bacterium]|jgi:AraC-like DNA-binding protein/mannose-6-phosphate isomerase-like protein (cupin superfamily)
MNQEYFDKENYSDIPLYRMNENPNGDLPFFIKRYTLSNATTKMHRHEYMQINYVYQGKAEHVINNQKFDIIKGDIFVIPPFIPHQIGAPGNLSAQIVEFEFMPEFINPNFDDIKNAESYLDFAYIEPFLVSENLVKPRLNLIGGLQIEVEKILNEAIREYEQKKPGYVLLIKSLLLHLLVLVGREFKTNLEISETHSIYDRHREAIQMAVEYIDTHYQEDLMVEDVARISSLSPSYFARLFKSITLKTFTEYLSGVRISKALVLLRETDKKVIDICYECGFNNVNHFNRVFKQRVGISPLTYREMMY